MNSEEWRQLSTVLYTMHERHEGEMRQFWSDCCTICASMASWAEEQENKPCLGSFSELPESIGNSVLTEWTDLPQYPRRRCRFRENL